MNEVGFLVATDQTIWKKYIKAFEDQLKTLNWKVVTTAPAAANEIRITYVDANGDASKYSSIASKFVKDKVNIIVTSGTAPAVACRDETKGGSPPIPVVFASVGDPEGSGLTPGHMTGGWNEQTSDEMVDERVSHLIEIWNKKNKNPISTLGIVYNDKCAPSVKEMNLAISAALDESMGVQGLPVRRQVDIQNLSASGVDAFYVCSDPLLTKYSDDLPKTKFAAHAFAEYCDDHGGACSAGPNLKGMFGTAATYVTLILSAAKPSEFAGLLPVFTGPIEHRPKKDDSKSKRRSTGNRSAAKRSSGKRPRARR
jgi:putative ABC transport system substrate-binding protein